MGKGGEGEGEGEGGGGFAPLGCRWYRFVCASIAYMLPPPFPLIFSDQSVLSSLTVF